VFVYITHRKDYIYIYIYLSGGVVLQSLRRLGMQPAYSECKLYYYYLSLSLCANMYINLEQKSAGLLCLCVKLPPLISNIQIFLLRQIKRSHWFKPSPSGFKSLNFQTGRSAWEFLFQLLWWEGANQSRLRTVLRTNGRRQVCIYIYR
jgi:hypothetical protein